MICAIWGVCAKRNLQVPLQIQVIAHLTDTDAILQGSPFSVSTSLLQYLLEEWLVYHNLLGPTKFMVQINKPELAAVRPDRTL